MARQARSESIDPSVVQIVHATQRCVRQAFLCGSDPHSGESFEHRRKWLRDRLEYQASLFGIDCLTFAILNNHLHVILRSRPDVVEGWSDDEVAQRWLRLCPVRRLPNGEPAEPTQNELNMILDNPDRLKELRRRFSDISWWMKFASEYIARRANKEENKRGHFWEGRFDAQLLIDEASLLACAMYVDLNPVRAAMAETPEESEFTGAKERIDDLKGTRDSKTDESDHQAERSGAGAASGWLAPIEIDEFLDPSGPDAAAGRRASNRGFLPVSLTHYLELLDWTGRAIRSDRRGSIPESLAPILSRIGVDAERWCTLVRKFGRLFKRVAGTTESVAAEAARRGQNYFHCPGSLLFCTADS